MQPETHYLNTDLDITAPLDLTPLAEALAGRGGNGTEELIS